MITEELKYEFFKLRDLIIERDFNHLDNEQRKAVLSNNRNSLVLACPGSGKTTVLINRVVYLINYGNIYKSEFFPEELNNSDLVLLKQYLEDKNIIYSIGYKQKLEYLLGPKKEKASNIIVITFTKAAALNMKKRFEAISNENISPFFGTFHGLFYKLLMRNIRNINIIGASESYRLISNILIKHFDEVSEDKIKEVRNKISLYKCSDIPIEKFEADMDKNIFKDCYNSYEEYKHEKALIDFDDLQIKFRDLLFNTPNLLEQYRKWFTHVLVDEFQDIDNIQLYILKMLNAYNSVFGVGDEDQCIYSFRGSRPDYMVDFDKHFQNGTKYYLSTNYRSAENVVKISASLIKNNIMRNKKNMIAFKKEKRVLEVLRYQTENYQAEDIAVVIEKLRSVGAYKYEECAVLYRTNMESRSLIDAFIRKKIPFRLFDKEYNFFDHFICKDFLAYLKLSIFPDDKESFKRIINKPYRYVSKISLEKLNSSIIRSNCFETIKVMESTPVFQIKTLDKLEKDIHNLNKMSLQSAIDYINSALGYHDYILEYSQKFKIQVSELEEIIEEFKEACMNYNSIITLLAHVEEVKEQLSKVTANANEDSVILSTIHSVKGMEFKNVFIINCVEEIIPHVNNSEEGLEEERRLFFVALTRTIDNVFVCIPRNVRGKLKEPSRFIEECNININENLQEIYKIDVEVMHSSFGRGKVISFDKNVIEIRFENSINRRFDIAVIHNNGIIKKIN
jgi:DNA helicase-2/ATP-dependent DNA helicase PcrA